MSKRIEFYKNRDIGGRLSAAIDFLKENWKILYKNVLIGGLPLAAILGFSLASQSGAVSTFGAPGAFLFMFLSFFLSYLSMIYMYSMTGAVLLHYERNRLTETTGWSDLKDDFFRLAKKTTQISLIVFVPVIIIIAIIVAVFVLLITSTNGGSNASAFISVMVLMLFIFLFLGVFIAIAPSFVMLYFPAYFSGKEILQSIKISFTLGFKNWGSLFVSILLVGIILGIISVMFNLPFQLLLLFSPGEITVVSYILATLSAIGSLIATPITVIIFAFQYFSIVEKEEGISLQSKIDEFENL